MGLGQHVPVLPEDLGHLIDGLLVDVRGDKQGQLDAGGGHGLVLAGIGARRDLAGGVPRILGLEGLHLLRGDRHDLGVGGGHDLGDGGVRRAGHDPHAVQQLVADRVGGSGGIHVLGLDVIERLADGAQVHARLVHGGGARRADGDLLADQVLQALDAGGLGHDDLVRVDVQAREDAQLVVGVALEGGDALLRLVHEVRVGDADLGLAVIRLVQVVDASAGRGRHGAHALDVVVPQLADGRADRVERGRGTCGHEVDVRRHRAGGAQQQGQAQKARKDLFHGNSPLLLLECISDAALARSASIDSITPLRRWAAPGRAPAGQGQPPLR